MTIWLIILGMALVTYGVRLLPLTSLDYSRLPSWMKRGLAYVPISVLSAIIGPSFVPSPNWGEFVLDERLLAGILAVVMAYFSRNTIATIGVGLAVLVALG
jgi:branched-subunit amino acid transport protein